MVQGGEVSTQEYTSNIRNLLHFLERTSFISDFKSVFFPAKAPEVSVNHSKSPPDGASSPPVIELDDGKILTGKPDQFDGQNHGFL